MPGELEQFLIKKEGEHLQRYAAHLLEPDTERTLILTAHAVIEQLLGDMIATRLSHPDIWLKESDFRSRTNLARSMGLIGNAELNVCRVLNTARNSAAHGLDPVPEKWRTEILRLGASANEKEPMLGGSELHKALHVLVVRVAAPWLYARVSRARHELLGQHGERWQQLMVERLKELTDPEAVLLDKDLRARLSEEVNERLAQELKGGRNSEE